MRAALAYAYAFKPGRTFAQALAGALVADGTGVLDTDWTAKLSLAGIVAVITFLQIWGEGGDQFADSDTSNKILGRA
jgi:hypothetical protein